jgi:hypothetical protein
MRIADRTIRTIPTAPKLALFGRGAALRTVVADAVATAPLRATVGVTTTTSVTVR